MSVPRIYLPQAPILVRVELRDAAGRRAVEQWDADVMLETDPAGVMLSTNRIRLRNGLGSTLVRVTGSGDFNLSATWDHLRTSRAVTDLSGETVSTYGGTLPGVATTWSGLILITNDVTVPAGHTLTIESNTLVLLAGVAAGTAAADIVVQGALQSLGTEAHPVHITCVSNHLNWGQIRHVNAQPSLYRHTMITKGGRATAEGHTGTGPVFRPTGSRLAFESSTISDATAFNGTTIGKVMQASGSDLTFDDCILARARMGPEITTTALLCTNTWINEMTGPDDADGIYLHDAPGRRLLMTGCVIGPGNDDAIDLLNAVVDIENCVVRDWPNPNEDAKGVSAFGGVTRLARCLFVNCYVGVSGKSSGSQTLVTLNNCTVTGILRGVGAAFKDNARAGNIDYRLTNCIVQSADAIHSDFSPTNFSSITHCQLSEAWTGAGNSTSDPLFVDAGGANFRLQSISPCIDSGHPASGLDLDGSPADRGCFPFLAPPPTLERILLLSGGLEFALRAYTNRHYIVQQSADMLEWSDFTTVWQGAEAVLVRDESPPESSRKFYRARLAP